MQQILLIEDDPEIVDLIALHLDQQQFKLTNIDRAQEALKTVKTGNFDLILMDIGLPDGNGMELCKAVRLYDADVPVIMLTAEADEAEKVLALELGADDYITKPFSMLELKARLKAVLRRSNRNSVQAAKSDIHFRDLCIEGEKKKVAVSGQRIDLTVKEFELLYLLAANPGKTFSRKELLQEIWGVGFEGYEHTITSHINRLRLKLEKDINRPEYILTAWGAGYRFAE